MSDAVLSGIRRIHRQYVRYTRQFLSPYQYSHTMHLTLLYIHHHPGTNQEEAACFYSLDKTAVARDCRKLEEIGHLYRTIDPENRRQNQLFLTEAGEAFVPVIREMSDRFSEKISAGFTPEEWDTLAGLLDRVEKTIRTKPEKNG